MDYLLFAIGLALLLWGADLLVNATTGLARRLGISALTSAVVVVGIGTSMPELLTSLDAALQGSPALAIANVVGSNIANILLVLGVSTLLAPVVCDRGAMRRDLKGLMLASVLALLALQQGTVERWMGFLLAAGLIVYLAVLLVSGRHANPTAPGAIEPEHPQVGVGNGLMRCLLSIAVLVAGAHLLVVGALGIARHLGVSESVIGLSLVAIGTSLPELAVAILALLRRNTEVAIGNVIGSCLFNLLGILGITALVSPLEVPDTIARFDVWIMVGAATALTAFARTGWRITRMEGAALLLGYPIYLSVLLS